MTHFEKLLFCSGNNLQFARDVISKNKGKEKIDRFVDMDDVSGFGNRSNAFESFSVVARKFKYSFSYIF